MSPDRGFWLVCNVRRSNEFKCAISGSLHFVWSLGRGAANICLGFIRIHAYTLVVMYKNSTIACSGSKASHSVPLIRYGEKLPWYSSVSSGIVATAKDMPLCWSVLPNCLIAFETALKILVELEALGWAVV